MQERSHAFAMKSQMWLLDPRPNLPSMVSAVENAFELSEASNTPVFLELRMRACHVYGSFTAKDNCKPKMSLREAMENPQRDLERIVLPPASFVHEQEKVSKRWPAAVDYIRKNQLNELFDGERNDIGIIVQGGHYNALQRTMERLGLADAFGGTQIPIYVLNVTYPLVDDEVTEFCAGKNAVLLVEEGQPNYIEQAINTVLRKSGSNTRLYGKDVLPPAGEYTSKVLRSGLVGFMREADPSYEAPEDPMRAMATFIDAVSPHVPERMPGLCTGCPERPVFASLKMLQQELGELGAAGAAAFNTESSKPVISIMGDGGFWHNGLTSGIGNAVFNQSDALTIVVDNNYSAATGGQELLSSKGDIKNRSTQHPIERAARGVGVNWAKTVKTYDIAEMRKTLREAVSSKNTGPKVLVAQSECMLNRQRREKPLFAKAVKNGERVTRDRFGVDEETCTGDHACIRLSGCPSLTVKPNPDPLKTQPVSFVDNSCVGCGNCGEVAHEAVLCPSFYKAEVIFNPNAFDRILWRIRSAVIGWLQLRADKRRLRMA